MGCRTCQTSYSIDDMRSQVYSGSSLLLRRVGSLHYLCSQCGHQNIHSLVTGRHELPHHEELDSTQSLCGELDPWGGRTRRQKRRRRRTITTDHDYESLSTRLSSSRPSSHMSTLDVRIRLTPEVLRESGAFSVRGSSDGESVYDHIRVREEGMGTGSSLCSGDSGVQASYSQSPSGGDQGHRGHSVLQRAKCFQQKITRKCRNKLNSFSLLK